MTGLDTIEEYTLLDWFGPHAHTFTDDVIGMCKMGKAGSFTEDYLLELDGIAQRLMNHVRQYMPTHRITLVLLRKTLGLLCQLNHPSDDITQATLRQMDPEAFGYIARYYGMSDTVLQAIQYIQHHTVGWVNKYIREEPRFGGYAIERTYEQDVDRINGFFVESYRDMFGLVRIFHGFGALPQFKWDRLFVRTIIRGPISVLRFLLVHTVHPGIQNNLAIRYTSRHGVAKMVRLLLADRRVDPGAQNNEAIRMASTHGHLKIVQRLLADKRVDPSAEENEAIRNACSGGHVKIIQLLLADRRVDQNNEAIRHACAGGYVEIVQLLLADRRVYPSAEENEAIQQASAHGHVEIVRLLLADKRVDPSALRNEALQLASSEGHAEIVQLLLADKRVDPRAQAPHRYYWLTGVANPTIDERIEMDRWRRF